MATPTTVNEFLEVTRKSGVLDETRFREHFPEDSDLPDDPRDCAAELVRANLLTEFQARHFLDGKFRGFSLGPYRILRPLGKGGMGVVYLGEHIELRRKVALKVLPNDKLIDQLTLERFLREARAVAALDHPNIVRIHDVGQQGNVRFLVMEFVEGDTLESLLQKGGAMGQSRGVDYIAQAAAGLQHAYEKGFVHRDIKPANLMLAKDGTIKILDLGLARSTADPKDKLTEALDQGGVAGTADYIAPEQAMGTDAVDIRADIYSLGATFFALVTGRPPFAGTTTQKLMQHQAADAPSLLTLDKTFPTGLAAVVEKMLEKQPIKRYQTPADVIAALAEWLPDAGAARVVAGLSGSETAASDRMQRTLATLVSGSTRKRKTREKESLWKKHRWAITAGAGGVVVAFALGLFLLLGGSSDKPARAANATPPQAGAAPAYDRANDRKDGLVGHWRFGAPVTKSVKDDSGLGQTGTIEGAAEWSREDGRAALRFTGNAGFVRVPDHPRLLFKRGDSFTLAAWVKAPAELVGGRWQGVITKPDGRADGWYGLWLANMDGERVWTFGTSFTDHLANLHGSAATNEWQHVCIVQNSAQNTRRIYVDGVDVTRGGRPGAAKNCDGVGDLLIGTARYYEANGTLVNEQFRGAIAEVQLYSRALTPAEIAQAARPRD